MFQCYGTRSQETFHEGKRPYFCVIQHPPPTGQACGRTGPPSRKARTSSTVAAKKADPKGPSRRVGRPRALPKEATPPKRGTKHSVPPREQESESDSELDEFFDSLLFDPHASSTSPTKCRRYQSDLQVEPLVVAPRRSVQPVCSDMSLNETSRRLNETFHIHSQPGLAEATEVRLHETTRRLHETPQGRTPVSGSRGRLVSEHDGSDGTDAT